MQPALPHGPKGQDSLRDWQVQYLVVVPHAHTRQRWRCPTPVVSEPQPLFGLSFGEDAGTIVIHTNGAF